MSEWVSECVCKKKEEKKGKEGKEDKNKRWSLSKSVRVWGRD